MEQPTEGVTMEKLSIWIGAIVAAFGVTWLVWDVNWWTTGSGYFSSSPFWLAATLAGAGWALARFGPRGRSPTSWSGLRAFLQRLFVVAVVFLGLSASFAPFVDPKGPTYRAAMKSDLRNLVNAVPAPSTTRTPLPDRPVAEVARSRAGVDCNFEYMRHAKRPSRPLARGCGLQLPGSADVA